VRLTWRERVAGDPTLRDVTGWPVIPLDTIPRKRRKAFLRNQCIVAEVLAGTAEQVVAHRHSVSPGRVSQLLDRCLGGDDASAPARTVGLIPYSVLARKQRRSPLGALGRPRGDACAFQALLDAVPELRDNLDALIRAGLKRADNALRPTPAAVHGEFKRTLAEQHWPRDRYPYTTESIAYEAVRRYLHERTEAIMRELQYAKQRPPRELGLSQPIRRALRATQIDEHILDARGRVHLHFNDELIPLRVGRMAVSVAIDVDSECVLGFHLAETRAPNQQDMLALLDNCLRPWTPLALATPGLAYTPGACFPSGLQPPYPISFGTVHMDNAWLHSAKSVTSLLCDQLGATIALGLPGQPLIRALVESVFDYINKHGSHRLPSTTGSHPKDPKREPRKHQKRPPRVTVQTIREVLSVILSDYNVTPRAQLGGASPLALFQHHCRNHFVRYVPTLIRRQWQPFIDSEERPVHWHIAEHRSPYVNFYHARYQGPGLLKVAGKGAHVRLESDRRDIRTLHAYSVTGEDLGTLQVSRSWQRFPHSLAMRRYLHKHAKRFRLDMRDPLASYARLLLAHKDDARHALSLLRICTEFTGGSGGQLVLPDEQSLQQSRPPPSRYTWSTNLASHRE